MLLVIIVMVLNMTSDLTGHMVSFLLCTYVLILSTP